MLHASRHVRDLLGSRRTTTTETGSTHRRLSARPRRWRWLSGQRVRGGHPVHRQVQPACLDHSAFLGAYTDTHPTRRRLHRPQSTEEADRIGLGRTEVCLTDNQIPGRARRPLSPSTPCKGHGHDLLPAHAAGRDGLHRRRCRSPATALTTKERATKLRTASAATTRTSTRPAPNGDANTILYAVIPWTAGGLGDYHLTAADQTAAYDCQDGGNDPSSKPMAERESTETQQEPNQARPRSRRRLRHGPGRPDHQPDRRRAAEHGH